MYRNRTMLNLRHHSLVAWQRADDLFIRVHLLTLNVFPQVRTISSSAPNSEKRPTGCPQTSLKAMAVGKGANVSAI